MRRRRSDAVKRLERQMLELGERMDRIGQSTSTGMLRGEVVEVDHATRAAVVELADGSRTPALVGHGGYSPEVGEVVQLLMNGNAPILQPGVAEHRVGHAARVDSIAGPNLIVNGGFETGDLTGWDGSIGMYAWLFQSSAESWAAVSASTTCTWYDQPANPPGVNGDECIRAAGTGVSIEITSPTGTSGRPCAAGEPVIAAAYVRGGLLSAPEYGVRIRFYNSGGALIATVDPSAYTPISRVRWTALFTSTVAPANTAYVAVVVLRNPAHTTTDVIYVANVVCTQSQTQALTVTSDVNYVTEGAYALEVDCTTANGHDTVWAPGPALSLTGVEGGGYYTLSYDWVNDTGAPLNVNVRSIVFFLDDADALCGVTCGNWPIGPPPDGANHGEVTVRAPSNAVAARICLFATSSYAVYIDNVQFSKLSVISEAKLAPSGAIADNNVFFARSGGFPKIERVSGSIVESSNPNTILRIANPLRPVQVMVILGSSLLTNAPDTVTDMSLRVGISFDNEQTWDMGVLQQVFPQVTTGTVILPCHAMHARSGLPTDDIAVCAELDFSGTIPNNGDTLYATNAHVFVIVTSIGPPGLTD